MRRAAVVEPSLEQLLAFCAEDPIERVFLEDVARRGLGRFKGIAPGGRLAAVCHLGANVVPSGVECHRLAKAVLESGGARMIIGEERAVGELWDALRERMIRPREDRPAQPVFSIQQPPEAGRTGLRDATLDDLERLLPACAAAHEEELGIDPLQRDAEAFRWRTRTLIEEGRSWIWVDNGTILFKAEAAAWTPAAVQIQQVWVDPAVRRQGHAQRAMRDLCRLLLERVPAVTLFVRRENEAAIGLYEHIGMHRTHFFRSLLF